MHLDVGNLAAMNNELPLSAAFDAHAFNISCRKPRRPGNVKLASCQRASQLKSKQAKKSQNIGEGELADAEEAT